MLATSPRSSGRSFSPRTPDWVPGLASTKIYRGPMLWRSRSAGAVRLLGEKGSDEGYVDRRSRGAEGVGRL
jgi:hypothetical protein